MRTLIQPEIKVELANINPSSYKIEGKLKNSKVGLGFKFYQKLFLILLTSSTLLIFPESPKNSEDLCNKYHSIGACAVW